MCEVEQHLRHRRVFSSFLCFHGRLDRKQSYRSIEIYQWLKISTATHSTVSTLNDRDHTEYYVCTSNYLPDALGDLHIKTSLSLFWRWNMNLLSCFLVKRPPYHRSGFWSSDHIIQLPWLYSDRMFDMRLLNIPKINFRA